MSGFITFNSTKASAPFLGRDNVEAEPVQEQDIYIAKASLSSTTNIVGL